MGFISIVCEFLIMAWHRRAGAEAGVFCHLRLDLGHRGRLYCLILARTRMERYLQELGRMAGCLPSPPGCPSSGRSLTSDSPTIGSKNAQRIGGDGNLW